MEKKGELTTTEIVMIIVLIVSFIVILYVLYELNLGATSNSQVCYNSVVLEAKSASLVGNLNCKTDYVCISGGGKCTGINPTETITVDPHNKDQIMGAIADQMANCWYTFGSGKLSYMGISAGNVCAVCSVIEFDNTIQSIYTGTENPQSYVGLDYDYCVAELGYGLCATILPNGQSSSPNTPTDELEYKDLVNYFATKTTTVGGSNETYLYYLYGAYNISSLLSTSSIISQLYNTQIISPSSSYSIITGESKTIFTIFSHGNYLPPMAIKISDTSKYLGSQCGTFVTQS